MDSLYRGVLGASVPRENAADLKTVGWEFTLGWKDRIGDLNYSASFVLSDSQGEVTKFDNPTRQIGKHYAGEKFGEIWGFKTDGLFQTQEQLDHAPDMTALNGESRNLGDVRFRDIDGDGKVDFGDNTETIRVTDLFLVILHQDINMELPWVLNGRELISLSFFKG